jgi:Fe-S oxidoreductase
VVHHTEFINELLRLEKIKIKGTNSFKGKKITYHDSCYIGRANGIYEAPRAIIEQLDLDLVELKRCKSNGLCCGAGGAQMFKEEESGTTRINEERTREIIASEASVVAANCPFCITMLQDGIKSKGKEEDVMVLDLAELILNNIS